MEYRSCDEVLRVFNPQAYILRFRVRLPDDLRLINVFDEFFADLIESKAAINKVRDRRKEEDKRDPIDSNTCSSCGKSA